MKMETKIDLSPKELRYSTYEILYGAYEDNMFLIEQKISKKEGRKAKTKPTSVFLIPKDQQPFPNSEHKHKNVQPPSVLTFIVSVMY